MQSALVQGIDHVSFIVRDTERAVDFYRGVLGLSSVARPELGFPGAWLTLGSEVTLHLLELPNPDPQRGRPEHGGRDRHIALRVSALEPILIELDRRSVPFTRSRSGRPAVFFRDPDGNAIEVLVRS